MHYLCSAIIDALFMFISVSMRIIIIIIIIIMCLYSVMICLCSDMMSLFGTDLSVRECSVFVR